MKVDKSPIPNIDDLFDKVAGGQLCTTLDLSNAYQQVVLDQESRKLTTINTSKGLFEYERIPFGVCGTAKCENSAKCENDAKCEKQSTLNVKIPLNVKNLR